jgi:sulfoxide reductase heme-binding subunit YedZ
VNPLWYATRATGEVAFLLLTAALVFGTLTAARFGGRRLPRFVVAGLHRNLSLVSLVFLGGHLLTAIVDPFAGLGVTDAVLPFGADYRPLWVGLGAIGLDLVLALVVTSLLRERLGQRTWRLLHWAAYGCWLAALLHALGTGTDTRTTIGMLLAGSAAGAALLAIGWRLAAGRPDRAGARLTLAALGMVTVLLVFAWTLTGPLAPGWARRAGTPANLLGGSAPAGRPAVRPGAGQVPSAIPVPSTGDRDDGGGAE